MDPTPPEFASIPTKLEIDKYDRNVFLLSFISSLDSMQVVVRACIEANSGSVY